MSAQNQGGAILPSRAWRWLALSCLIHANAAVAAGGNEFLDMSLEELVDYRLMSMSRKEQRVADMAAAAHVISADEIRRSGAQSIPEALRLVPGLNVAQLSPNHWAVSSRGFNERFSGKLLVQVDGRSVYSPMFSGVLWETQDTLMEDIERIEVIRGPGAALWGTNAMNGVINIVTRSAAASQGLLTSVSVGSNDQMAMSLRQGGELLQGGHYKIYGRTNSQGSTVGIGQGLDGSEGSRQKRVGLWLTPQVDAGQLSIKADAHQSRYADVWIVPTVLAYSDPATPFSRESVMSGRDQGGSLQARYAWKSGAGAENVLQTSIDHDSTIYRGVWGSGAGLLKPVGTAPAMTDVGGTKTDLDLDFQQRTGRGAHDVIWGVNLRHTRDALQMPASPYLLLDGKDVRTNYSAFVHDEWTLVPERFKLILGSKFEKDGLTGFNVQPNARVLYTPGEHEVYWGALSRSVRSTRRTESLATVDVSASDGAALNGLTGLNLPAGRVTALTQVSPRWGTALRAEDALSLEAGWRKQFAHFLSVDTAFFVTDYSHLRTGRQSSPAVSGLPQALACLAEAANAPGTCYFTLDGYNADEATARSWGAEFSLEWHPSTKWKVQSAYSHLRVKGQSTSDRFGHAQVKTFENSSPRHQFSVNNNFSLAHDLSLDVRIRHNTSTAHYLINQTVMTTLPAYTGLDVRLGWQPNRHTELSVQGRNLLTGQHIEFINVLPSMRAYAVQRNVSVQAVFRY